LVKKLLEHAGLARAGLGGDFHDSKPATFPNQIQLPKQHFHILLANKRTSPSLVLTPQL
jgi:hypothetical protein